MSIDFLAGFFYGILVVLAANCISFVIDYFVSKNKN